MKTALEHRFTGPTTTMAAYDSTKTSIGDLIKQYNGANSTDKFVSPLTIGVGRPMEIGGLVPCSMPHGFAWDANTDYIFYADNAAASLNRRVVMYTFDRLTSTYSHRGYITITMPSVTGTNTTRGFKVARELYTVGTVTVNGTSVTGSGTGWTTSRLAAGSRIGFGSTNPTEITQWFEIGTITNDTTMTLALTAGTIASGTSYVIEDLRVLMTCTNATATAGGLTVVKGLRYELFTGAGTTIPAATTIDNIRAAYWLADAATLTNTGAAGCALGVRTSWQDQRCYVIDTSGRCYVYNFRAALTLAAARDNTTNVIRTGIQVLTGTLSQVNNGNIGTLYHDVGNGVESLYFVTTTRIYRSALTNIVDSSTTWISDMMLEVMPFNNINTLTVTNTLSGVAVCTVTDRLVIYNTTLRHYVTKYRTDGSPIDHMFLINDQKLGDAGIGDVNMPIYPATSGTVLHVWVINGLLHMVRATALATTNQLYSLPLGAHWTFGSTTGNRVISPVFTTNNISYFGNLYVNILNYYGTTDFNIPPEPYRCYYRLTGISNNTGAWTLIPNDGDLSGVTPGTQIQFMFEFKVLGNFCIPARMLGFTCTYEDQNTDNRYLASVNKSSIVNRSFAYRQAGLFTGSIPNLRMRIYNADSGVLVLDDTVNLSAYGVWEYSTDSGVTWLPWSSSANVIGNYIRYTATYLPSSIKVRVALSV